MGKQSSEQVQSKQRAEVANPASAAMIHPANMEAKGTLSVVHGTQLRQATSCDEAQDKQDEADEASDEGFEEAFEEVSEEPFEEDVDNDEMASDVANELPNKCEEG